METDSGVSLSKARSSTPAPSRKSCDPPAALGEGLDASFLETIRSQDTEISRVNAIQELRLVFKILLLAFCSVLS